MKPTLSSLPLSRSFLPPAQAKVSAALRGLLSGDRALLDPTRDIGDPGLCGPDSVSWRLVSDVAALAGGVRALLLQTCHRAAVSGVVEHSAYTTDPLGRLQRTVEFVTVCTFGSHNEANEAAARVRGVHDRVRGTLPDGAHYSASDPRLLEWVHITLIDSFLVAHREFGGFRLTRAEEDRFVAEQAGIVRLLGNVDAPTTVGELGEHLASYDTEIGACDATATAVRFLTAPPLPLWARGPYTLILGGAVATMERKHLAVLDLRLPPLSAPAARFAARGTLGTLRQLSTGYGSNQMATARINGSDPTTAITALA